MDDPCEGYYINSPGRLAAVRRRFESASRSQGVDPATFATLRRHLDGISVEASIGDIVDSCRVWESHAKAGCDGQDRKFPHTIPQVAEEAQPQLGSMASDTLQESTGLLLLMPELSPPGVTCNSYNG